MRRPKDQLPAPPELPSFTIQDSPSESNGAPRAAPDPAQRYAGSGLVRHDAPLPEQNIDEDAAKVVRRLERAGFEAYLVGGCVRDLLLERKPKDFDIATSARPEDVRSIFRNCRIIGRRFRLAHVLFSGGKVIEVATFRRNPQTEGPDEEPLDDNDDLLIRSDNVFGEAPDDALRRDFTINALFYDLDRRQVLDWCGGMRDIQRRTIHTIGDPTVRFREDPVRILRAIKFAARLDLGIAPDCYDAMVMNREELAKAARPRLFEEILRLLRGGAAHRSMWLLWEIGAMAILLPELAAFLDDDEATAGGGERFWRRMAAIDRHTHAHGPLGDSVLWATLLREPMDEACLDVRDTVGAAMEFLEPIVARIAMPRRISDAVRRIYAMQPRLAQGRLGRLVRVDVAAEALEVLALDLSSRGKSTASLDAMREEVRVAAPPPRANFRSGGGRPRRGRGERRG